MSIKRVEIARVTMVEGKSFTFIRETSFGSGTYQGVVDMPVYLGDIIETDTNTTIEILFHIGGAFTIPPGEKVAITGQRKIITIDFDTSVRSRRLQDFLKKGLEIEMGLRPRPIELRPSGIRG